MGTNFVRGMLVEARPKNFSELIQISGLSHGTDVWTGNADELIRSGTCTIAEVIGCRDSIMLYLLRKGLEPKMAFDIMEAVRKGKVAKGGFKDGWEEAMREHEVPDWYIESCRKIKYMFPKAHAVAYLMSAIRLMWFKIYRPPEFYAVYFTVRGDDIDYEAAVGGAAVARAHMEEVKRRLKEEKNAKDEDVLVSLQLVNEMLVRGYEFLPIELGKSRGSKYVVEDGKVRLPFSSLKGLGGAAADALEKVTIHGEEYISVEELQQAKSLLDPLLGSHAGIIFALALLMAGISSTITSGMAAGSIFAGIFGESYHIKDIHSKVGILISLGIALVLIFFIENPFYGLIISQMILSIQLPFTVFLQVGLTSSKRVMGKYANSRWSSFVLYTIAVIVSALNIMLLLS